MHQDLASMSDRELTAAADRAWGRGETGALEAIKTEKQRRSASRGGIGARLKALLRKR